MKIVIIEDEIRIREGLRHLLEKTCSEDEVAGEAENGRDGMALILKAHPDLVLADIRMPEMDGIEMLRQVQQQGETPEVIFLSAYSDFSYAQQAVKLGVREYLLKPMVVSELPEAIARVREVHRQAALVQQSQRTLTETLEGCIFGSSAVDDQTLDYLDTQLNWPTNVPMALVALHGSDTQLALWRRLCGSQELPRNETLETGGSILTLFCEGSEHVMFELGKHLLPLLADEEGCRPAAVGCIIEHFGDLRERVQACLSALDNGLIVNRLIRCEELGAWQMEQLPYPIELETAARSAISRHDHAAVRARMRDFLHLFTCGRLYRPRDIKETCVRFVWSLLSTARELGHPGVERLSRQQLVSRISSACMLPEIENVVLEMSDLLCADAGKPRIAGPLVLRAESLMKEHFAQGITLEEIAQTLSVTPEYLGTQIHRELGMTFGTLMKQLRVEKAKELLLSTNMKLYEISEAVGYADAKYFSRIFHTMTGLLPIAYRRMNR